MRNSSLAKLSGRPSSLGGNSIGWAGVAEMWALNSSTLPSVLVRSLQVVAAGSGSPSVDMPSVMLTTSGG